MIHLPTTFNFKILNMTQAEKIRFLKEEFAPLLHRLQPESPGKWGVMNAQQMVEHFTASLQMASGRLVIPLLTTAENLPKMRAFMLSERPFKENTKNPSIPEVPAPCRNPGLQEAITELENELHYFFDVFQQKPGLTTLNNIFGDLNFDENIHLVHKHARHHLAQFGLI